MIRPALSLSAVVVSLVLFSCEKHDWEETKALFEPHGYSGESHGKEGHSKDHSELKDHHKGAVKPSATHH